MVLENVILGFLMEGNMSGYDIKNFMSVSTANFFDASFGSIYPALKRLETKGFIVSREVIDGGKYKKMYEITEEGKKVFYEWMEQPADLSGASHEHLLKAFFFNHIPKETACIKISEFIAGAKNELCKLEEIEKTIESHADIYKMTTLLFGKEYYGFVARWYEDFLKKL